MGGWNFKNINTTCSNSSFYEHTKKIDVMIPPKHLYLYVAVLLIITDNVEWPVAHIYIQMKAMKTYIDVTMIVIIDASYIRALEYTIEY